MKTDQSNRLRPHVIGALGFSLVTLVFGCQARPNEEGKALGNPGPQAVLSESVLEQMRMLSDEKLSRTPAQEKLSSALVFAVKRRRADPMFLALPDLRSGLELSERGDVLVDIKATVDQPLLDLIVSLGGRITASVPRFDAVEAEMPLDSLESLAAAWQVRWIREELGRTTRKTNTSEGDVAHRANVTRALRGINGSGITIGVISDAVDSLAARQATGDLPAAPQLQVLSGQAGSGGDEGTAMLEIVYDLAPGANLLFATGYTSAAQMAQNILNLQAAGAKIIVDDVAYYGEGAFQDDVIAQAVNTVTAAGVLYFSSAGNDGNKNDGTSGTYEGDYLAATSVPSAITSTYGAFGDVHDFGGGTRYDTITLDGSAYRIFLLQWSDPLEGSSNDYDLFIMNSGLTTVYYHSGGSQTGTQPPLEWVAGTGGNLTGYVLVIARKPSAAARYLRLTAQPERRLAINTNGSVFGHAAAENAFAVAAVNVATASGGAFVGGTTNPVETFSSDGPRKIFYSSNGTPITPGNFLSSGGTVRAKPDLAAADGVTTATPGFAPFFGTSAAAPHAAAIAGLLLQARPDVVALGNATATTTVRSLINATSLDIDAAGWDYDSGAGIMMANTIVPPAPPIGVSASDGTYTDKAQVSWTSSSGATSYQVYRNTANASAGATQIGTPTASPYDDTTATAGTTYWYFVKACSAAACSDFTISDSGYRALSPPTGVAATDGIYTDKVQVSWIASTGATSYQVYRNTANASAGATQIGTPAASPYDDGTATIAATYYYFVKACAGAICSDFSVSDSGYRTLSPPTGVTASDGIYTDKVQVSWIAPTGATSYQVYRNTANASAGATQVGTPAASPYGDTTATPGTTYYYFVKACAGAICSDFSASDSGYRMLSAPTGVAASDGTYTDKVQVSWNASTGATSYQVYRNTANASAGATQIGTPAASPYDDGTATIAATYWYFVKACAGAICSDFSVSDSGYRTLSPPTGVTASDGAYTDKVQVSWSASTGATSYQVYRNTANASAGAAQVGTPAASPYGDTTATPGTTYYYFVKACAGAICSDFSASDSGYCMLSAPTGVAASDGTYTDKVQVSWNASTGATSYQVYRNTANASAGATQIGTPAASPYDDGTATIAATYWYFVKACAGATCSDFSVSDSGYRTLSPPTGVTASDGAYTDKVQVSWSASTGATSYQVYRNTANASAGAAQVGTPAASPYGDTTATPGTTYYYFVKACAGTICSDFSASDSGYCMLSAPTGVAASDGTYTDKVQVSWNASTGATSYQVYRNTANASAGATSIGTPAASPYDDGTATIAATYWYFVKACAGAICSDFSASDSGYRALSPPTGVAATDGTYTDRVQVSWIASTGAASYQVYRNTANASAGATQIGTPAASPYDDTTATAGTTYYYFVKACAGTIVSDFSASDSGYRATPPPPAPPTKVAATDGTYADKVQVGWSASTGATWYQVYRNTSNSTSAATQIGTLAASPYDDTAATAGVTYYYFVKACNTGGCSDFSASDSGYRLNDDIAAAATIGTVPFLSSIDASNATVAGDDPALTACSRPVGAKSVWYSYTPSTSRLVYLDTFGSNYDTMIGVFTGARGSLTAIACNDDDARSGVNSAVALNATAGTTYSIVVYSFAGTKSALSASALAAGVDVVAAPLGFEQAPDGSYTSKAPDAAAPDAPVALAQTPGGSERLNAPDAQMAAPTATTLQFHATSFYDVAGNYVFWRYIEGFYSQRITTGCGATPLSYCPESAVTRAEMAVFLLRAKHGGTYQPPAQTGIFADVPVAGKEWMQPWVEQFYHEGMTTGCGANPLRYCPEAQTTRAEMSVFVLRSTHGPTYQPPAATGIFVDLPVAGKEWMQPWVEQYYHEGITTGCAANPLRYCPENSVTRAEMAVFVSRAYSITQLP